MAMDPIRFRVRDIEFFERPVQLRLPFRFGVVTLRQCPQAFVRVRIEDAAGRPSWGQAAEVMAPKWFDKNLALSNEDNFDQLRQVLADARAHYLGDATPATAFGHFARHYAAHLEHGRGRGFNPLLAAYGPALLDKALADAACRAAGQSFYAAVHGNLLGIAPQGTGLAPDLDGFDWGAFLGALRPAASIAARHTVGMVDPITAADVQEPVDDGLPQTLQEVIARHGIRHFKIKVGGDLSHDLPRLRSLAGVLPGPAAGCFVSLDGNEQFDDAAHFSAWWREVRADPALAGLVQAVGFIEQPIRRDRALEADIDAAQLGLPVIVDESDGELDTFVQARRRGYRGVSSKSCKGLYKSILNAARCQVWNRAAQADGAGRFFMTGEDLTTQAGLGVQQDLALVNLLGLGHVERNGHHYVNGMAALARSEQLRFLQAHPDLYEDTHGAVRLRIEAGRIQLGSLACTGLASACAPDFDTMQPMAVPAHA